MLDIHVLVLPGLPKEWVEDRRKSIDAAVTQAGFPCHVHEVEGIPDHLGKSRKKGYSLGTSQYVTHVDYDDLVLPNAFQVLHDAMLDGRSCITTGEKLLLPSGHLEDCPLSKHHLAVFKRIVIEALPYEDFKHYPDQFLLSNFVPAHIPECVYIHRIWQESKSRQARGSDQTAALAELERISNPALSRIEAMTFSEIAAEVDKELANESA